MSWTDIPGWTCTRLREWYDEVLERSSSSDVLVEIGVAYGASLAYLTRGVHHRRFYGVDIWQEHQGRETLSKDVWERVTGHGNPMRACVRELELFSPHTLSRTTLIRSTGVEAADGFPDESVFNVFLDEHHTYKSVSDAIKAWLPRVEVGGYLSGHDCNPHYPGVSLAVDELLPGAEYRDPHPDDNGWGGVWIYRKPAR